MLSTLRHSTSHAAAYGSSSTSNNTRSVFTATTTTATTVVDTPTTTTITNTSGFDTNTSRVARNVYSAATTTTPSVSRTNATIPNSIMTMMPMKQRLEIKNWLEREEWVCHWNAHPNHIRIYMNEKDAEIARKKIQLQVKNWKIEVILYYLPIRAFMMGPQLSSKQITNKTLNELGLYYGKNPEKHKELMKVVELSDFTDTIDESVETFLW